jgi:hypothetical protein
MVLSGVRTSAAMSRLGSWGRSIQTSLVQTRRLETDDDTPAFVLGTALSCGGRHECARRVAQEERATAMRCLSKLRWHCSASVHADEQSSVIVSPRATGAAKPAIVSRCAHLRDVATPELRPFDRRAVLAVVVGVQLSGRTELREPGVPGLGILPHAARSVPANKQPVAVMVLDGIVPALRLDSCFDVGHG